MGLNYESRHDFLDFKDFGLSIAKVGFCCLYLISMFFIDFSKSLWYKMSHLTEMQLFCKQFTFEMFKIMALALSDVSVWLDLSCY